MKMKISEAREKFLAAYREKKTGMSAYKCQVTTTREFLEFMKTRQVTELEQLTPGGVEEYRKRLLERVVPMTGKPIAPKTAGSRLVIVRNFLEHATANGWMPKNPATWITGGMSQKTGAHFLTAEELRQVLSKPDLQEFDGLRDRAILEVIYAAGVRSGEVAALELEDVALEAGRLRSRSFIDGKERESSLTASAREFLGRYLKEVRPAWAQLPGEGQGERRGTALFIEPMRGNPLNKSTVEKIVADYVRQVKPGISTPCRVIRDACVARLQAEGATMEAINDLVGGLKTTRRKGETTQIING
jgi:integrase/recombinase XerD